MHFVSKKTTPASLVGVVSCRRNPPIFQGPRHGPLRQVVNKHLACLDARTQGLQCSFRSYGQETRGVRETDFQGARSVVGQTCLTHAMLEHTCLMKASLEWSFTVTRNPRVDVLQSTLSNQQSFVLMLSWSKTSRGRPLHRLANKTTGPPRHSACALSLSPPLNGHDASGLTRTHFHGAFTGVSR